MADSNYDAEYAAAQIARRESPIRRLVKSFYLGNVVKHVKGATIDFGCGAGQILERLPGGSMGIEVNPHLVEYLTDIGLTVEQYYPEQDGLSFADIPERKFQTLVLSHVLEHFASAEQELPKLMASAERLGIERVIFVVPGKKGYQHDATHETFIDESFLDDNHLGRIGQFSVSSITYFPLNRRWVGDYFTFHETMIIYDRVG